jgi:threonine dehydratase
LRLYGKQSVETEVYARHYAEENKLPFVHPYNDLDIISGQGTIVLELMQQVNRFDAVYVPIGGGGLISGIAYYLKSLKPHIKIIGCQPKNASEMHDSIKIGKIVEPSTIETIADGTAGGLDPDTCTFEFCKNYVDEIVLVSEDEIAEAVYLIYKFHDMKVEPAAALSVASILKHKKRIGTKKNIAIISGSKITENRFKNIINKFSN